MSDVAEEAMDSSAMSEEDQQEAVQEDETSPNKSSSRSSAVGEIIEGKRAKKMVERLDFQAPKPKEKLKIGDGSGDKLGDIPRTQYHISRMKPADLKPLHTILFDRPGKMATIKKNLRLFNGFLFDADSEQFSKKREKLLKNSNFTNPKLKVVCTVLDLEKKGTHSDLIDRILIFLTAPKNNGKPVPMKKKRKSKKKLAGDDLKARTRRSRRKTRSSSSSPKKSKSGSKSKAIVMDSSSDDDEDEDEKAGASAEAEESYGEEKPSEKEEECSEDSEESAEEDEEEEKESKSVSGRGKKREVLGKRKQTPAKKMRSPKKRTRKESSDESDGDSESEEKPKKKPAAKSKKAESINSSNKAKTADDSSDNEPLIRMMKKAPSSEELKETVQSLLKEANLEEMTMKQICQRVFDTYPEHDLSSRKDFIKQTVKSLIT